VHRKAPYYHDDRYHVTVFQRDPGKGSIISVTLSFGFMEDPNVERILAELAGHHQINLPPDPHKWIVHVSVEEPASGPGRDRDGALAAAAILVAAPRFAARALLLRAGQ
jgi:hypothetical protein